MEGLAVDGAAEPDMENDSWGWFALIPDPLNPEDFIISDIGWNLDKNEIEIKFNL